MQSGPDSTLSRVNQPQPAEIKESPSAKRLSLTDQFTDITFDFIKRECLMKDIELADACDFFTNMHSINDLAGTDNPLASIFITQLKSFHTLIDPEEALAQVRLRLMREALHNGASKSILDVLRVDEPKN